jgi:hypothetical protein
LGSIKRFIPLTCMMSLPITCLPFW